MNQGLYTAATGMMAVEARQSALANNIANVSTPGFKRHAPVQLGFYQTFSEVMRHPFHFNARSAPAGGVKVVETFTDLGGGAMQSTGNPLNVGIQGPGYFAVDTPRGERFTRAGDFSIDIDGHLATSEGFKVQSVAGGAIEVNGGQLIVAADGSVTVDGAPMGQIRLVEFAQPERLLREGTNLYLANDEVMNQSTEVANAVQQNTRLNQSNLERSNIDVTNEISSMMLGLRAYEANQKVIQALDGTLSQVISQGGMPS